MPRRLTVLLGAALLGLLGGCRPAPDPLTQGLVALQQARELDARLEGAEDPAALEGERDRRFQEAERLCRQALANDATCAEAHLALLTVAWDYRQDAVTAMREANAAIATLEALPAARLTQPRRDGRTGREVLAAAYGERAGLLLQAYQRPAAGQQPGIPAGPLDQAAADADHALALDDREAYRLLHAQIVALRDTKAQPFDPASLQERPAAAP